MDKQKQIEEMVITAYPIYATMEDSLRKEAIECMNSYTVFERLYNAGYRKADDLLKELQSMKSDFAKDMLEIKETYEKEVVDLVNGVRKETAEKFAERLKDLEEALLDMVVQFCQMGEEGKLKHIFMSAEEQAFDVLDITYGENVDDVYERFNKKWDRPIDEIAKEITEG